MHRSGTSGLTRLLNLLGADLPRTLIPPSSNNERGYWESERLREAHDNFLESVGSRWDDIRSLDEGLYGSEAASRQIGRATCRERVCQYGSISVVAVAIKKKKKKHQRKSRK